MTIVPDLSVPIRNALIGDASITSLLEPYKGSFAVFTRTPVPTDAPSLVVVISHNLSSTHDDGVNDRRLLVTRTITVTGQNPNDYRAVDQLSRLIAARFHRQERNLIVPEWNVFQLTVSSAGGAGTDLDQTVSMVLSLSIRLAASAQ